MVDTVRTLPELLALYADNNTGRISPQDGRDFMVSVFQGPIDVTALLADETPSYPTGTILRTKTEGFAYEVADPSATDQDRTTAGGVKLYKIHGGQIPAGSDTPPYQRMLSNARYGEPLSFLDILSPTQAEAALDHTLTDDVSAELNTLLTDDRANNILVDGLLPFSNTIDVLETSFTTHGLSIASARHGRSRAITGELNGCIFQKKSDWTGGLLLSVNALATNVIQTVHIDGISFDGAGEAGGVMLLRYLQDASGRFECVNDLGEGVVWDGVWNSVFSHTFVKNCLGGGGIFRPTSRENSNIGFHSDPHFSGNGGLGELLFEDGANNTGSIRFFNLLVEGLTAGTDSDALIIIENAKRLQFIAPQINSQDGRDSHCVTVGKASRVGELDAISFISPNFNNTGTKTNENCLNMVEVESGVIDIVSPKRDGNSRFFKSDAGTQPSAVTVFAQTGFIDGTNDFLALDSTADVTMIGDGIDLGNKGAGNSPSRAVSTTPSKPMLMAATTTGGVEVGLLIDPDDNTIDGGNLGVINTPSELTVSSGAITITGAAHSVDTEGDAATDTVDNINGLAPFQSVLLGAEGSNRDVTYSSGVGNVTTTTGASVTVANLNQLVRATASPNGNTVIIEPVL